MSKVILGMNFILCTFNCSQICQNYPKELVFSERQKKKSWWQSFSLRTTLIKLCDRSVYCFTIRYLLNILYFFNHSFLDALVLWHFNAFDFFGENTWESQNCVFELFHKQLWFSEGHHLDEYEFFSNSAW